MNLNINQITILVKDAEKAITFYEQLGLRLIVKSIAKYARFECVTGETTFSLHESDADNSSNSTWIYFESETLDEDVGTLQALGVEFESLPEDKPWLWREARLKDLDNNQLIICHAGENRKNPPWKLN